jgi:hypothetical protein
MHLRGPNGSHAGSAPAHGPAARDRMIDVLVRAHGRTREQTYMLCRVATDPVIGRMLDIANYRVLSIIDPKVRDGVKA